MRGQINRMSKWIWLELLELHGEESNYCRCPLNLNLNGVCNNIVGHWVLWRRSFIWALCRTKCACAWVHMVYINVSFSPYMKLYLNWTWKKYLGNTTHTIYCSKCSQLEEYGRAVFTKEWVFSAIIVSLLWQTHTSVKLHSQCKSIHQMTTAFFIFSPQLFYDWYLLLCFSDLGGKI